MKNKIFRTILLLFCSIAFFIAACCFLAGCGNKGDSSQNMDHVNEPFQEEDIFHDIGQPYVSKIEPTSTDDVTMRLRVRRGSVTQAKLMYTTDLQNENSSDCAWTELEMQFEKPDVSGYYDYYVCTVPAQSSSYRYHFLIENNTDSVVYSMEGCTRNEASAPESIGSDFLAQVDFSTPDWSKGMLWYSAMPDSFFNGEVFSDKYGGSITQNIWGLTHSGGLDYFGGDLFGLYEKIGYFQDLNIDGVYINPIWLANHNAGYGAMDLTNLDSTFGSEKMLSELIGALHENDMKFMMDGVFAFLTDASIYVNKNGLWITENAEDLSSPYYNVFVRNQNGQIMSNQFGPIVDLGKKEAQELIYSSSGSVMQYYLTQFGLDGWRLDSSVLFGGTNTNGTKIIQDMRKYMKSVAPDSLLCIENASASTMYTDYAADTYWSQEFLAGVQKFASGDVTADSLKQLAGSCYDTVVKLPRATGLALYLISADHDTLRLLDYTGGDEEKALSVHLLLMTYMGAPSLFYGEEIGMVSNSDHSFFTGMNWDRSTWNYDIYNLIRSLGEFRAANEDLFKYGILENLGVDETNLLMKYRRSYGDTNILTVLNPNGEIKNGVEIDVRGMELKDGEKIYDYLSGNSYTVSGGKVTIKVMPYGALLTNKSGNEWAGKWELVGSGNGEVRQEGEADYAVNGEGTLGAGRYAVLPMYNNGAIKFSAEGNVLVTMRSGMEDGSDYYGVEIRGTQCEVKQRSGGEEKTLTTIEISAGETLYLVRGNDNEFRVERGEGQIVSGSEGYIEAGNKIYCGFGALSGEGKVRNVQLEARDGQKSTEFVKTTDSMMDTYGEINASEAGNGKLTLKASKNGVYRLTHAPMRDYTIKTEMTGTPKANGVMGLTVWQSENCYIFAGRAFIDGQSKLVLGQMVNGTLFLHSSIPDVNGTIVLQLERTGTNWAARYRLSSEADFVLIGQHLIANFSDMYAGLVNVGTSSAEFSYFCFGDSIHDGESYSAHAKYGELSLADVSYGEYGLVAYSAEGGTWEMVNGGVSQTDKNAANARYKTNQTFQFFRADYSLNFLEVTSKTAYVGLFFGSSAENYSVRLFMDGTVSFMRGGTVIRSTVIEGFSYKDQSAVRLFVQYSDSKTLTVLEGGKARVLMSITGVEASSGGLYWQGSGASYRISSYQCQAYSDNYPIYGDCAVTGQNIYNPNGSLSVISEGLTDFVLSFDLTQFQRSKPADKIYFGFVLGGSVGLGENGDQTMIIGMTLAKEVFISVSGEKLAAEKLPDSYKVESLHFKIVVQDKEIKIFVGETEEDCQLVLQYKDSIARGGAFTFECVNARTKIENVFVYGLKPGEAYENL